MERLLLRLAAFVIFLAMVSAVFMFDAAKLYVGAKIIKEALR